MQSGVAALGFDAGGGRTVLVTSPAPASAPSAIAEGSASERLALERFYALLGPVQELLEDPLMQNIDVNADGGIFVERFGAPKARHPATMPRAARAALTSYLANTEYGRAMDALHSELDLDLPHYGSRVHAACPPIEDWTLCIRVPIANVPELESYVEHGIMTQAQFDVIVAAIVAQRKLAIAGNVNTGKTTLLNAALKKKAEFHSHMRAVAVQDRREIRLADFPDHKIIMAQVEQAHHEANGVVVRYTYSYADALAAALRSNGKFLVWSEVREQASAFGLALASNTGQTAGLMFTLHAESLWEIPARLGELILLDNKPVIPRMVGRTFGTVIYMEQDDRTGRRRVVNVGEVTTTDAEWKVEVVA